MLRAWRTLDADDTMCMQKNELFKAVNELCWPGDARLLWKGLDKDTGASYIAHYRRRDPILAMYGPCEYDILMYTT